MSTNLRRDEIEKVKEERLQKFGSSLSDNKEQTEKRKLKFSLKGIFPTS